MTGSIPARELLSTAFCMGVQKAVDMGATAAVNSRSSTDAVEEVMQATGRRGVDVALEAVGLPSTFELCQARPAQLPGSRVPPVTVLYSSRQLPVLQVEVVRLHPSKVRQTAVAATRTCNPSCLNAELNQMEAVEAKRRAS